MKRIIFLFTLLSAMQTFAQHQLQKIWETDSVLAVPESVLPHLEKGILYVSLIDGQPWDADGKGGIGQVDLNGKVINPMWVSGLNAPKGMARVGNNLYVADLNQVAVIDITNGKIVNRISIDSAQGLNDVTADSKGTIYVSDSRAGKVFRISNNKPELYLSGYNGINGVKAHGNDLYVVSRELYKVDAAKNRVSLGKLEQGGDGIEPVGNGDWIGSAWSGYVYYFYADGRRDLLLDTHEQQKNTADFGFDPAKKIVYIPTFSKKSVMAYQLK